MGVWSWLRVVAVVAAPLLLLPLPILLNKRLDCEGGKVVQTGEECEGEGVLQTGQEWSAAYVVLLMGVYWVLELLPLPITALLPVVLLPMMGIVSTEEICHYYMKGTGMLFIGGLIVAIAVEHSNLHRRIAIGILNLIGTSTRMVMLGFMIPTAFLSMWISNTATTVMMIPILEAVLDALGASDNMMKMMMLSICFSANIGGTGTVIGTAPNLIMVDALEEFPGQPINFLSWIGFSLPQMVINLLLCWIYLQVMFLGFSLKQSSEEASKQAEVKSLLRDKMRELGSLTWHEAVVTVDFLVLVALWFFRDPDFMVGWAPAISPGGQGYVKDATPALAMTTLLFFIPANPSFWPKRDKEGVPLPDTGETCLTWEVVEKRMAWGVIILVGGGFAASAGTELSGLNSLIGKQLESLEGLPNIAILFLILIMMSCVTQIASNAATTSMLMPVIKTLSLKLQVNPLFFMLPAALTASCAFMLPVSTAPNAIVFEASKMRTVDLMKAGFGMNIITMLVIVANTYTVGMLMFDLDTYPAWANSTSTAPDLFIATVLD